MTKINELDPKDRPREKLLEKGVGALTSAELLQVIIGSGVQGADVVKISNQLLSLLEMYSGKITIDQMTKIKGISTATASKVVASLEVAARFVKTGSKITDISDIAMILSDIRVKKQEHFILLTLDGADCLIERHVISIGTVNANLIHPRDVFTRAMIDNAASVIIAHNHPGGSLEPSVADNEVTERLKEVGRLVGIPVQSHIILTRQDVSVI